MATHVNSAAADEDEEGKREREGEKDREKTEKKTQNPLLYAFAHLTPSSGKDSL